MKELHEGIGFATLLLVNIQLRLPDDTGNKRLAGALIEVNKHYRLPMPSPKQQALLALGIACVTVYKPVVMSAFDQAQAAEVPQRSAPVVPAVSEHMPTQPAATDWFPMGNA